MELGSILGRRRPWNLYFAFHSVYCLFNLCYENWNLYTPTKLKPMAGKVNITTYFCTISRESGADSVPPYHSQCFPPKETSNLTTKEKLIYLSQWTHLEGNATKRLLNLGQSTWICDWVGTLAAETGWLKESSLTSEIIKINTSWLQEINLPLFKTWFPFLFK